MGRTSWVSADGGAMDRVALLCAVLLGACAALMIAVTAVRGVWPAVGFWTVVTAVSIVVGWRCLRRIRGVSRSGPS